MRRADALDQVTARTLERAVRADHLRRPLPSTYVDGKSSGDLDALMRAAVVYANGIAVVSHTSALRVWRLPGPTTPPIHLTTAPDHHLRGARNIRVHRRQGFALEPPAAVVRDGVPVTRLERTIVDCWPLMNDDVRRAPAILAVAQRMTTADRLAEALEERPRLGGRRYLAELITLLRAGCRSELELWGYQRVFSGPPFASLRRQYPVRINGHTVYLDGLDLATGTNFEVDGAKYHANPHDRERDLRRDTALQALGMVVVRYTHHRLTSEPSAVRREAIEILATRPTGWTLPAAARVIDWPGT